MRRRSFFAVDVSLLLTIPLVCLLCMDSVQGEIHINVSYTGSDVTFTNYSDRTLFSKRFDNIPGSGIQGHLFLPTPVNACSYIDPPPGGFPTNSTWIALVYDYPSCPTDMVMNIRNAGYRLIIASSRNDSHRTVSREVSDSLFPIVIVREYYTDYLSATATSNSTNDPVFVSVKGSIDISFTIALVSSLFVSFFVFCYCVICCCCCLSDEHVLRFQQMFRQEQTQSIRTHEQLRRQELTESIPMRKYNSKKETSNSCVICVDEFIEGEQVRVLPCSHIFHPQCIDEWLGKHSSLCPLCKKEISEQGRSECRENTDSTRDEERVVSGERPHSWGQGLNQQATYGSV